MLYSIHFGISAITHSPELALDAEESAKLAKASANVMRHYNVRTTAKAMDWIQLSIVLGMVYTPRIILLSSKRRPQAASPARVDNAQVRVPPAPSADDLAGVPPSFLQ